MIKDVETEEFKADVGFSRDLWPTGVWHPNTPTYGGAFNDDFMGWPVRGGRSASGASTSSCGTSRPCAIPTPSSTRCTPSRLDGGKPYYQAGSGQFGVTYIKQQSSPERVKMLLRIANYFAAPFGSQEWLLNYFGVKDTDYKFNADGAPVLTDQGRSELTAVWRYVTSPAYALFSANRSQEFANVSLRRRAGDDRGHGTRPDPRPVLGDGGLPGPAGARRAAIGRLGHHPGSPPDADLDGLVAEWRTKAGDKMRGEFQDAIAAAKRDRGVSATVEKMRECRRRAPAALRARRSARRAAGRSSAGCW